MSTLYRLKIGTYILLHVGILFVLLQIICISCTNRNERNTYSNPLIAEGCYPYACFYNGKYYYTQQSEDRIVLWCTPDLTEVSKAPKKTVWLPRDPTNKYHIWSPELHRIDGKWYIYFEADDSNTDNHHIYVIENTAADPMQGRFVMKGAVMTNPEWNWGIHPSTFQNKGKQYLLWSGWPKRRIDAETQCIYIASMKNPWTLDSKRVMISYPRYEWERQWINPDGSRTAYPIFVNENPEAFISPDGKKVIVCYSASGCWSPYYCVGMLWAHTGSNLLDPASWQKKSDPIFYQSPEDSIYGTSSASFIPSPDGKEWYVLYQAKNAPNRWVSGPDVNSVRMQKISWDARSLPVLGKPIRRDVRLPMPSGTIRQEQ